MGDESPQDRLFGECLDRIISNYRDKEVHPSVRIEYEPLPSESEEMFRGKLEGNRGKDRSQWSNFWADNYTNASIIGFMDGEVCIHTPLLLEQVLTNDMRLINAAFVGDHWGVDAVVLAGEMNHDITMSKTPLDVMWTNRFPIWFLRSSLSIVRDMIRERFGRERFNGAFAELTNIVPTFGFYNLRKGFCQFNLLLNHAYNAETDRHLFRFLNQGG